MNVIILFLEHKKLPERMNTMSLEKVKKIISEQFAISEDDITEDTVLMEDLDADSLDLIDLAMSLEDCFEVEVPDEELENFKTVGDIVKYIEEM